MSEDVKPEKACYKIALSSHQFVLNSIEEMRNQPMTPDSKLSLLSGKEVG